MSEKSGKKTESQINLNLKQFSNIKQLQNIQPENIPKESQTYDIPNENDNCQQKLSGNYIDKIDSNEKQEKRKNSTSKRKDSKKIDEKNKEEESEQNIEFMDFNFNMNPFNDINEQENINSDDDDLILEEREIKGDLYDSNQFTQNESNNLINNNIKNNENNIRLNEINIPRVLSGPIVIDTNNKNKNVLFNKNSSDNFINNNNDNDIYNNRNSHNPFMNNLNINNSFNISNNIGENINNSQNTTISNYLYGLNNTKTNYIYPHNFFDYSDRNSYNSYNNNYQRQISFFNSFSMNGKSGWICSYCQNFNYESKFIIILIVKFLIILARKICNRCGKDNINIFYQENPSLSSTNLPSITFNSLYKVNNTSKFKDKNSNSNQSLNGEGKYMSNIVSNQNLDTTKKKKKKYVVEREGDWICAKCNNLNFSFRNICNRCHLSKTENDDLILEIKKNEK